MSHLIENINKETENYKKESIRNVGLEKHSNK